MASLALRNLFHDRVRLVVTLTGVVFAVVLVAVQIGLFIGFNTSISNIIDHSGADLWVVSKGVPYIESGLPFSENKLYQVRGVEGVAQAEKYIVQFGRWKQSDGTEDNIEILGFNPNDPLGGPWNLVEGSVEDLKLADTVIIDRMYRKKLGVTHVGETVEIRGHRARIVGFTDGIRTFTTSPAVFTSFKNAQNYSGLAGDRTVYLLVKAAPGTDIKALSARIESKVRDVAALPTAEFSRRTVNYWMYGTGAGVTVIIAAVLGLIVGVVVVAQTIYASTIDHIREYGTLKAMGASNGYIYRVILKQATIAAVIGYALGITIAFGAVWSSKSGGASILLPAPVAVGLFGLTLAMCLGASLVSINKATRIDPAMVFKG